MPIDKWELLSWLVQREENEPSAPTVYGSMLVERAGTLNKGEDDRFQAVARAAGQLKRLGYIEWVYQGNMPSEAEPRPEDIDQAAIQRTRDIVVTDLGHTALEQRSAPASAPQINISNSVVGQLALGNISNIDILILLDAMERSLDKVEGSADEKAEARSVLRRMRDAGGSVANSTVSAILAAALRQALGLP
jgi:hypothetical protein